MGSNSASHRRQAKRGRAAQGATTSGGGRKCQTAEYCCSLCSVLLLLQYTGQATFSQHLHLKLQALLSALGRTYTPCCLLSLASEVAMITSLLPRCATRCAYRISVRRDSTAFPCSRYNNAKVSIIRTIDDQSLFSIYVTGRDNPRSCETLSHQLSDLRQRHHHQQKERQFRPGITRATRDSARLPRPLGALTHSPSRGQPPCDTERGARQLAIAWQLGWDQSTCRMDNRHQSELFFSIWSTMVFKGCGL